MKLPPLHEATDKASGKAQSRFLWMTRAQLIGLVLGAALSLEVLPSAVGPMRIAAAALLGMSAVATVLVNTLSLRETWYSGRAAAESVKTLAWRYAMGTPPFPVDLPVAEGEALFLERLKDVLRDISLEGVRLGTPTDPGQGQITEEMRSLRISKESERLGLYVEKRVMDQVQWYSREASWNDARSDRLSWCVGILQVLAVIMAVMVAAHPAWILNPVGLLTTLAAAVIAWSEKKGHQELAHAYAMTAQELEMAVTEATTTGATDLSRFVLDTEQAISREHTLWIARRTLRRPLSV